MSRLDQYVGLTKRAEDFLIGIKDLCNIEEIILRNSDQTLCGEEILGVRYILKDGTESYEEVIQLTPWSSGPMYFTSLVHTLYLPGGEIDAIHCFEWWVDPFLRGTNQEYDKNTGGYYL